jgi:glycosyltransferase involved in cell wall biosynthesis
MRMSTKVLYIYDSLRAGGKERQLVELLKGLIEYSDFIPALISLGNDKFFEQDIKRIGVNVYYLERKAKWDLTIFQKMLNIIENEKPDIVQSSCWMSSFYALPICKLKRIPLVNNSIRNTFRVNNIKWHIEQMLILLSPLRLANSKAGLSSRNLSLKNKKNIVVYNGIDFNRFKNFSSSNYTNKSFVVGMVAEFKDHKDYDTYLAAADKLTNAYKNIKFYAIGGGTNLDRYKKKYNYNDRIIFTGRVSNVEDYVYKFDVGVLTTYTEGMSNSIIEYMALGKPVIATDGGGTNELIQNNITGILLEPENIDMLVNEITRLMGDQDLRKLMGKNGRQRIRNKFSSERMVKAIIKLYSELLDK